MASGAPGSTRTFEILVPKYNEDLEERCKAFPIYMGNEAETKVYNVTTSAKWVEDNGQPLALKKQNELQLNYSVRSSLHSQAAHSVQA